MAQYNKTKSGRRQKLCAFLAAFVLFLSSFLIAPFSARAQAAGSQTGSLQITVTYEADTGKTGETEDKPAAGMKISLYRTADLVKKSGSFSYQPDEDFSSVSVSYEKMTASQSGAAAKKLAQAAEGVKPDEQGVTGSDGTLSFSNLEPGIYLAVQEGETGNVTMAPCLWQVPQPQVNKKTGAVSWQYDVQVRPKTQAEKPSGPPTKPPIKRKTVTRTSVKTGDPSPSPLPYMISMAASLAAIILLVVQRRKEGQD